MIHKKRNPLWNAQVSESKDGYDVWQKDGKDWIHYSFGQPLEIHRIKENGITKKRTSIKKEERKKVKRVKKEKKFKLLF